MCGLCVCVCNRPLSVRACPSPVRPSVEDPLALAALLQGTAGSSCLPASTAPLTPASPQVTQRAPEVQLLLADLLQSFLRVPTGHGISGPPVPDMENYGMFSLTYSGNPCNVFSAS